jgi:hypothetical protein
MPSQPPWVLLVETLQVGLVSLLFIRFSPGFIVQHLSHSASNILHHVVYPVVGRDSQLK